MAPLACSMQPAQISLHNIEIHADQTLETYTHNSTCRTTAIRYVYRAGKEKGKEKTNPAVILSSMAAARKLSASIPCPHSPPAVGLGRVSALQVQVTSRRLGHHLSFPPPLLLRGRSTCASSRGSSRINCRCVHDAGWGRKQRQKHPMATRRHHTQRRILEGLFRMHPGTQCGMFKTAAGRQGSWRPWVEPCWRIRKDVSDNLRLRRPGSPSLDRRRVALKSLRDRQMGKTAEPQYKVVYLAV